MANETYPDFAAARPVATEIQDGDTILIVRSGITYAATPDLLPGRLVAQARTAANVDYADTDEAVINFGTVDYDPGGDITTGASWHYTVPADGRLRVVVPLAIVRSQGAAWSDGDFVQINLYVNGTIVATLAFYQSPGAASTTAWYPLQGGRAVDCVAGDTIDLQFQNASGATRRLGANAAIEIYRV